ncbi:hypothetical protein [Aminiphilus sp.]|uniref:hypothetical protein n=1 Tax=Aminiphilus sp. TaxID=1872488 RepID=UPI002612D733|nr:hypothetical protein [Aminiphilus sp.]
MELHEFEEYCRLRNILEQRCEELCHLYAQIYFDLERDDREIHVNSVETGKSGRILIQYSTGQEEEMLYLPPEYLWRTNEEVRVLMELDRDRKDKELKERRAART